MTEQSEKGARAWGAKTTLSKKFPHDKPPGPQAGGVLPEEIAVKPKVVTVWPTGTVYSACQWPHADVSSRDIGEWAIGYNHVVGEVRSNLKLHDVRPEAAAVCQRDHDRAAGLSVDDLV